MREGSGADLSCCDEDAARMQGEAEDVVRVLQVERLRMAPVDSDHGRSGAARSPGHKEGGGQTYSQS